MRYGQAAVEYILVLLVLTVIVLAIGSFVFVVQRHADRTEVLVTSDCP